MSEREIRFSQRIHAVLKGYTLRFNKVASANPQESKGNIIENEDEVVEGVLYAIPESDMRKLDRCEGFPTDYDKKLVPVQFDDGVEVRAVTYIAQPNKIREVLKPTRKFQVCKRLSIRRTCVQIHRRQGKAELGTLSNHRVD